MEKAHITILRHGSTELNEKGQLRGWLNVPLSAKGVAEAERAGRFLAPDKFDKIYASDLDRTVKTAAAVGKYHANAPVEWTPALRPINFGDLQGNPYAEVKKELDDLWAAWGNELSICAPGGESFDDFQKRTYPFLSSLRGRVLLVTHTRTASYILAIALNKCKTINPNGEGSVSLMHTLKVACGDIARVDAGKIAQINPIEHEGNYKTSLS